MIWDDEKKSKIQKHFKDLLKLFGDDVYFRNYGEIVAKLMEMGYYRIHFDYYEESAFPGDAMAVLPHPGAHDIQIKFSMRFLSRPVERLFLFYHEFAHIYLGQQPYLTTVPLSEEEQRQNEDDVSPFVYGVFLMEHRFMLQTDFIFSLNDHFFSQLLDNEMFNLDFQEFASYYKLPEDLVINLLLNTETEKKFHFLLLEISRTQNIPSIEIVKNAISEDYPESAKDVLTREGLLKYDTSVCKFIKGFYLVRTDVHCLTLKDCKLKCRAIPWENYVCVLGECTPLQAHQSSPND